MKQKIIVFLLLGILFVYSNAKIANRYHNNKYTYVVDSNTDSEGYYEYLPWTIILHQPLNQPYAIILPDGKLFNKYTCGVAILETPFFLIAHALAKPLGYDDNGYSDIYGFAIMLSSIIYIYISFYVLFIMLYKRYSRFVSIASILLLYFGTSLFYYTLLEPGMSHAYSFFCFTMILYFIEKYYEEFKRKYIFWIGFFLSLATLIRPTNILLVFLFLFYDAYSLSSIKEKVIFHLRNYLNIILIAIIGFVIFIPQMLYWHGLTGKYIFYSYVGETFSNWSSPKIFQVLIGHKSGWLLFAPLMLVSLVGLIWCWRKRTHQAPVVSIILLVILYICSSWWAYTFGCGYGYRSFTEYQAILLFPFAFVLDKILRSRYWILKVILFTLIIYAANYSVKLTTMYYSSGGCWDGPDWKWENQIDMMKQAFTN